MSKKFIISSIGLGVLTIAILLLWPKGIKVNIKNVGSEQINGIELSYTGGVKNIEFLDPDNKISFFIKPRSDSHLEIIFTDLDGIIHFKIIDVYFKRNYNGYVNINIDESNNVIWEDHIESKY